MNDDYEFLTGTGADLNDDGEVDLGEYLNYEEDFQRFLEESDKRRDEDDEDDDEWADSTGTPSPSPRRAEENRASVNSLPKTGATDDEQWKPMSTKHKILFAFLLPVPWTIAAVLGACDCEPFAETASFYPVMAVITFFLWLFAICVAKEKQ